MATEWTTEVRQFDPALILRTLADHDVRYVLVGGIAAIVHGYSGATFDADVVPDRGDGNLRRLAAALRALDARIFAGREGPGPGPGGAPPEAAVLDLDEPASLLQELAWYFSTVGGRLDVLLVIDGPGGFEPLAARATKVRVAGVEVAVASLADIIDSKAAAGRPKDLAALAELRRLAGRGPTGEEVSETS
ncbi:MAG TPA: hypothetical protein VM390_09510 [Acidimicrobiales bacterium]|jgi:hypothetical protein|nr:hypothetical protein [Acidimicrobiales bacterium]